MRGKFVTALGARSVSPAMEGLDWICASSLSGTRRREKWISEGETFSVCDSTATRIQVGQR